MGGGIAGGGSAKAMTQTQGDGRGTAYHVEKMSDVGRIGRDRYDPSR